MQVDNRQNLSRSGGAIKTTYHSIAIVVKLLGERRREERRSDVENNPEFIA